MYRCRQWTRPTWQCRMLRRQLRGGFFFFFVVWGLVSVGIGVCLPLKTMAAAPPAKPKKGANGGQSSGLLYTPSLIYGPIQCKQGNRFLGRFAVEDARQSTEGQRQNDIHHVGPGSPCSSTRKQRAGGSFSSPRCPIEAGFVRCTTLKNQHDRIKKTQNNTRARGRERESEGERESARESARARERERERGRDEGTSLSCVTSIRDDTLVIWRRLNCHVVGNVVVLQKTDVGVGWTMRRTSQTE